MFNSFRLLLCSLGLAFVITVSSSTSSADEVAQVCRDYTAGNVSATSHDGGCSGFVVRDQRGQVVRRVRFDSVMSGELLSSPDGRSVVMVQSYLYGFLNKRGHIVSHGGDSAVVNPAAVIVYRDGIRVASHLIHSLVVRPKLVTLSASHVQWLRRGYYKTIKRVLGPTLTLHTTSLRKVVINTVTGALQSATDADAWLQCDEIAYGKVKRTKSGAWRIDPAYVAKGSKRSAIKLGTVARGLFSGRPEYYTACIVRHKGKAKVQSVIDVMYNALTQ